MSDVHTQKRALHLLDQRLDKDRLPDDIQIFIVTSYPRSDMGKGTLVAHMLHILPDSNALKFDGLLNTNANGRHTAQGHDDFGIYEKYNPGKHFTEKHYILGGYLYQDFIEQYGEYENLTFRPYMSKHFLATIQERWQVIGRPRNLIIELGGTISDHEVDPYIPSALQEMKEMYGDNVRLILLTETSYNNEYIKTKTVQDSVGALLSRRLKPDIIIARDPSDLYDVTLEDRAEFERTIRNKLQENYGLAFQKIMSVPFYQQDQIDNYGKYLETHLRPVIIPGQDQKRVLIGSNNPHKHSDWRTFLKNEFEVITPKDLNLKIDVTEGMTSVKENSLAKAKAWCRVSGLPAITDDTGFYIHSLNGLPGVAVRRWAGQLPENTSDKEFFEFMKDQVKDLEDTSCYFETVITLALPNGEDYQVIYKTEGYIDKVLLNQNYKPGNFPLGLVFKKDGRNKVWAEMSDAEKRKSDGEMISKMLPLLREKLAGS